MSKTKLIALLLLFSSLLTKGLAQVNTPDTLDEVITEAKAREIFKGIFDFDRLAHAVAAGRIAKDERLTEYVDGFMDRNQIDVLTIGYIDSDRFWPRAFREGKLRRLERHESEKLLSARIIFNPQITDDKIRGYTVILNLEGKQDSVYQLLEITQEEIDAIVEEVIADSKDDQFSSPGVTKDLVVNNLIASLQQLDQGVDIKHDLIVFSQHPEQHFSFDEFKYEALSSDYPPLPVTGKTIRPAWKSIQTGSFDQVIASDSARFELNGQELTSSEVDGIRTINIQGISGGDESALEAKLGEDLVGVLNVVSYDQVINPVKVIPVNNPNISLPNLESRLNEIYAPAVANWEVEVLPDVDLGNDWDKDGDGALDDGSSGMLSNYTSEMNHLIRDWKRDGDRNKNTYYLYLINKPSSISKLGYMPRKKQFGFIFTDPHGGDSDLLIKTIAHELGHGTYRLEHTFSERGLPQGQTTNLMDYSSGTTLHKYQWDHIHDPAIVFGLFEEDEEGAMVASFVGGGWEECYRGLRAVSSEAFFENREELPIAKLNTDCYDGALFLLQSGELLWRTPDELGNDNYYVLDEEENIWLTFDLPPPDCLSCDLTWLVKEVEITGIRYLTPLEDVMILMDGKDLEGADASQLLAGTFLLIEVVPGGKLVKPVKRAISGGLNAKKIFVMANKTKVAIGEVVNGVFKPNQWIDDADEVIQVLENQRYLDEAGNEVEGTLEVVKDGSGNVGVRLKSLIDIEKISPLLKTEPNTAFFWSGRTNGIGGMNKAMEIAKKKGGTTLETLLEQKKVELPDFDPSNPSVVKAWEDVSSEYAKQVSGEVRAVIGRDLRPGNVWQTKELPLLKSNQMVTKITTIDPETLAETVILNR